MLTQFARNWWVVVLRGGLAILFGVLAILWPNLTIEALILLFGAYALVDGVFSSVAALTNTGEARRWWLLFEGLVGIIAGILTFMWPGLTAIALLFVIAAWAIITGIFEIMAAIELRREITGEWLLIANGILSVIFGVFIAFFPGAGALGVIWMIAVYAWIFGVVMVALGLRMRGWSNTPHSTPTVAGHGI